MAINGSAIVEVSRLLGVQETRGVVWLARRQDKIEGEWRLLARAEISEAVEAVLNNARKTGRLELERVDFTDFLMQHRHDIVRAGIESTTRTTPVPYTRLADGPAARSLASLRKWWDKYRRTGKPSKRQVELAEGLRKKFLEAIHQAWLEASEDFLSGNVAEQGVAVQHIRHKAQVVFSRAKMIVETETTRYFNKARRDVYDQSPDVTHYLFMAIRDHRTTKWCKTRHGLVYAKDDPLLDVETPPIHWYCRSELLPLTPANPNHLRLIEDLSRQRRLHICEPLPVGWNR